MPFNDDLPPRMMLFTAAAASGAFAGAGVGAVIAGVTGAAIGAAGGALASVAHMLILTRQASTRTPAAFTWLTILAALFCGLMAGFFFTFSFVIMRSLELQPGAAGMQVMQTINVAVFNPWFGFAFSATPALCVLAMNSAIFHRRESAAGYVLAGGVFYLVGTLYVTVLCNVPRNDALAAVSATSSAAASVWSTYLSEWTAWNHVRTAAAFAAAGLLTLATARKALTRHG